MNITLTIPTYLTNTRSIEYIIASIKNIENNHIFDYIVIQDDCSDYTLFEKLKKCLNYKITYFRNIVNKGPLINKYLAVKNSIYTKYVYLLDADNMLNNSIDILNNVMLEENTICCPSSGAVNYSSLPEIIDKKKAKSLINIRNFQLFLNNGNYLVNKDKYVEVFENIDNSLLEEFPSCKRSLDVLFFNYFWLKNNYIFKIIKGLKYYHRTNGGRNWAKHKYINKKVVRKIYSKIEEL